MKGAFNALEMCSFMPPGMGGRNRSIDECLGGQVSDKWMDRWVG